MPAVRTGISTDIPNVFVRIKVVMIDLLSIQDKATLSEWKKERGLAPDSDIVSYYSYLDTLSVPNHSIELNDDVVHTILSFLPSYALRSARCVCKQWSVVTLSQKERVITYEEDSAYEMSWYHLAKCGRTAAMMVHAARRGYVLTLEQCNPLKGLPLCQYLSEGTNGSDRHLTLFEKHFRYCMCDSLNDVRGIIKAIIKNDAYSMFTHLWELLRAAGVSPISYATCIASKEGLTRYLDFICDGSSRWGERRGEISAKTCIISAYCGGHFKEIVEYFGQNMSYEDILTEILIEPWYMYDMDSIEPLIFLFENCEYNKKISAIRYLYEVDFTVEQFSRLWNLIRDKISGVNTIVKDLIVSKKYEAVLYLRDCNEISKEVIQKVMIYLTPPVGASSNVDIEWVKSNLLISR